MATLTKEDIIALAEEGKFIALIKEHRFKYGTSLKESKETIESAEISHTQSGRKQYDIDKLLDIFELNEYKMSKEEFMNIIEEAIDNCGTYQMDMLDAVSLLVKNIQNKGGLEVIAKERSRFLNRI